MEKTSWRVERADLGDFVRFALVGRCDDYEHGFAVYSDLTAAKRRTLREMFRQDFARHLRVKAWSKSPDDPAAVSGVGA